eukprot:scaffold303234_cov43-Prasinocladus_malaysianus.AAC.1
MIIVAPCHGDPKKYWSICIVGTASCFWLHSGVLGWPVLTGGWHLGGAYAWCVGMGCGPAAQGGRGSLHGGAWQGEEAGDI